jgi:GT2 family glycosyltransferase
MSEPLVYAVTLNWNRCDDTLECLDSLADQTYPRLRLVVVDNGSSDDSVARLQRAFPQVTLLVNPRNVGFAAGANRGIRHALQAGGDLVSPYRQVTGSAVVQVA